MLFNRCCKNFNGIVSPKENLGIANLLLLLALPEGISVFTFSSSLVLALFIMFYHTLGKNKSFFSKENPQLEQNVALD
jgi:hypothetical protein